MAVLQISRIQLRRGKKNEASGLPQLASGEMAWAIDSQELYIGNGAVSEGAPAVGNTRILTENDNILDLAEQYQYKVNEPLIQTNTDVNFPVIRTLQDRLDDIATSSGYGILSGAGDQRDNIQNAITNLFVTANSRVVLQFQPGVFEIFDTIYIPSYVTIEGAGPENTIFNFTGTGTVFEFIKDDDGHSITQDTQPRFISMKGFSVETNNIATQVFEMNSVRDSVFEDINITGAWTTGNSTTSIGIGMYAFSTDVTCQRNKFTRVTVDGFCTGVLAKQDIFNNLFDDCGFKTLETGIKFGVADGNAPTFGQSGFQYGPRKNIIKNSRFEFINQYGIIIDKGYGNRSRSNNFINVGNNLTRNTYTYPQNKYAIIKFTNSGNSSTQDIFDRAIDLASNYFDARPYVADVAGLGFTSSSETHLVNISQSTSSSQAFRIPLTTLTSTALTINYLYQSTSYEQMRKGTMNIALDRINDNIQFTDEFEYTGTPGDDEHLTFSAQVQDIHGFQSIVIYYTNSNINDHATLTYSYTALS